MATRRDTGIGCWATIALPHGAFAAELGGAIVLMQVELPNGRRPTPGDPPLGFHGAMFELASQTWIEIPPPPSVLSGGLPPELLRAAPEVLDRDVRFVAAGERVAMLVYSSGPPRFSGEASTATAVFDTLSRGWKVVAQDDGPPREAYLTGPYRAQSTDRFWVWWPSHEGGTNYAGGYTLDLARATWTRTNPAGAPSKHSYSRPLQLPDGRLDRRCRPRATGPEPRARPSTP